MDDSTRMVEPFRHWRRSPWLSRLGIVWLMLAASATAWLASEPEGLVSNIMEWEYRVFDSHFPLLSLLVICLILGLPGIVLMALYRGQFLHGHRHERGKRTIRRSLALDITLYRVLAIGTAMTLVLAASLLIAAHMEPDGEGPASDISVTTPAAMLHPGHAVLHGHVRLDRIAAFRQNVLFLNREIRFAPVDRNTGEQTYLFMEVTPERIADLKSAGGDAAIEGILQRNGMNMAIVGLYRANGVDVAQPHYVLMASVLSVRLPLYALALNAAVLTLLLGIATLLHRRPLRRAHTAALACY